VCILLELHAMLTLNNITEYALKSKLNKFCFSFFRFAILLFPRLIIQKHREHILTSFASYFTNFQNLTFLLSFNQAAADRERHEAVSAFSKLISSVEQCQAEVLEVNNLTQLV